MRRIMYREQVNWLRRAVTTRWVGFVGFPSRAAAEFALRSLLAGSRP